MMRKNAVWFEGQFVALAEEHKDVKVEVVTNGTFAAIAPNGDSIKTDGYVGSWLIEHGITNDAELDAAMEGEPENGWTFSLSRVFDCITWLVREVDGRKVLSEVGWELMGTEYDEEMFKAAVQNELDHYRKEESQ